MCVCVCLYVCVCVFCLRVCLSIGGWRELKGQLWRVLVLITLVHAQMIVALDECG